MYLKLGLNDEFMHAAFFSRQKGAILMGMQNELELLLPILRGSTAKTEANL